MAEFLRDFCVISSAQSCSVRMFGKDARGK
jgi:hypothetical protein